MAKIISLEDIDKAMRKLPNKPGHSGGPDLYTLPSGAEELSDCLSPLYHFSEINETFKKMLNLLGLRWDEHAVFIDYDFTLAAVEMLASGVSDNLIDTPTWDEFRLSGDDDVDYNGGYILTGVEIIRVGLGDVG